MAWWFTVLYKRLLEKLISGPHVFGVRQSCLRRPETLLHQGLQGLPAALPAPPGGAPPDHASTPAPQSPGHLLRAEVLDGGVLLMQKTQQLSPDTYCTSLVRRPVEALKEMTSFDKISLYFG